IYINNIIIVLNSVEDYFRYFDVIFSLFISKNIVLSLKKSYFKYPNIKLLGFYINNFGLFIIKNKIKTFKNFTFPNSLKVFK
ncbi:hypothetical protein B0T20DRAFT_344550, partial [Sordaria brevicollis]